MALLEPVGKQHDYRCDPHASEGEEHSLSLGGEVRGVGQVQGGEDQGGERGGEEGDGNLQWQQAYSGGVYRGTDIGSYAYSLHQTSDGSYVLAGDEDIEQPEVTIEPWIAKVSSSGSLLWQHLYYQVYKPTGLPLSENFSGAAITSAGGFAAAGPTENYTAQKEELYVVQTDSSGNAGTCGDEYAGTPLQAISPELTGSAPSLPVQTATTPAASSPIATTATSISTQTDC